ncbi:MAG: tRNA lysidine(34) synthetase TilS [bacterium]|nr:tRNA lysidine(34) synthetase TilS [bacterium]
MSLNNISLPDGKYIVAVSGGVDSIVLLNLLATKLSPTTTLVVAHVDHGIRTESVDDAKFVEELAKKYGLKYENKRFELGAGASEEKARVSRYSFLFNLCEKHKAKLVTAHHQGDLIETSVLNILRGTGPHGLANMLSGELILRPLLKISKAEIISFAKENNLSWREDSTNHDQSYLRNYIRQNVIPKLEPEIPLLQSNIDITAKKTAEFDKLMKVLLQSYKQDNRFKRSGLLELDYKLLSYAVRQILIESGVKDISRDMIERVSIGIKTLLPGKKLDIDKLHRLSSYKDFVEITSTEQAPICII